MARRHPTNAVRATMPTVPPEVPYPLVRRTLHSGRVLSPVHASRRHLIQGQQGIIAYSSAGAERIPTASGRSGIPDLAPFRHPFIKEVSLAPMRCTGALTGGWLAAALAPRCPPYGQRLVLVGAAGIKPPLGESAARRMVLQHVVQKWRFADPVQIPDDETLGNRKRTPEEQEVQWRSRELTSRLGRTPCFHTPHLPAYWRDVTTPVRSSGASRIPSSWPTVASDTGLRSPTSLCRSSAAAGEIAAFCRQCEHVSPGSERALTEEERLWQWHRLQSTRICLPPR